MEVDKFIERLKWKLDMKDLRIDKLQKQVESQAQTIEAMKCCGNCRNWYLLAESSEVIKYCNLKHGENYTFRTDKCDKWEGVSRDD